MRGDTAAVVPVPASRRRWAWLALAAFAALVVALLTVVIASRASLLGVLGAFVLTVVVAAASLWWAFTTRKAWKRWLNYAVIAVLAVLFVLGIVAFGLLQPFGVLAIVAAAFVHAWATRRALTGDRPAPPAGVPLDAPPAHPWLLVNPRSGDGTAGRTGLIEAARQRGIQVAVLAPGDDPATLAHQAVAAGADALGVAGGDGSLGQVAPVAIEHDLPFVCVPAGTRNHFAHDLGLDRSNPVNALAAFEGAERRVDVGMVSGRMFLNNVSLGAYANLVADPAYREAKLATARAMLPGTMRRDHTPLDVEFSDPDGRVFDDVLVVLVANNRYQLERAAELGARDRLDDGVLQVSALTARTGAALAGIAARLASGRGFVGGQAWTQWESQALRVDSHQASVPAGLDGEAVAFVPPLEFRVLPGALRVLVPPSLPVPAATPPALSWLALRRVWAVASGHVGA
jgi:diacylglycerol kinase family enzyme